MFQHSWPRALLLLGAIALSHAALAAPDEARMGRDQGYPPCEPAALRMECRVGAFSNPTGRRVARPPLARPLEPYPSAPALSYRWGFQRITIDEYLARQKATGLLVLKDGRIVYENYQYGRTDAMALRSFSMAKTLTALLVGIAHEKGLIASLDDRADRYYRAIEGTPYGSTTIRNLLRMGSGVAFNENYGWSPDSDLLRFYRRINGVAPGGAEGAFRLFETREIEQGQRFNYATSETELLGRVLVHATGRHLTDLTREWLWEPIGAEADGHWMVGRSDGVENAGGGFFATLRDWGRLGLLMANDGKVGDRQVVPRQFLLEATDPKLQPAGFGPRRATPYFGYGYQTWIFPMRERSFAFLGIFGQSIFVQPASGIVMVQTSVYDQPSGSPMGAVRTEMWKGVLSSLGGDPSE
ncbi:MAG: 6-aminohexanoate-dimer hydrolase [Pseudomonadota bacterium]